MKGGAQAALAVGVGYVLGRRRKMRLATMLAIGAATGGIGGLGPAALRRGVKFLGSTDIGGALGPQVGDIVSTLRGDLLDAAKGAATAAVTNRIDSLSESLHDRAETLKNPEAAVGRAGEAVGEATGRAGDGVSRAGGRLGRLRRRGEPADDEETAELDEYEEPQDEYEDEPPEDELDEDEMPAGEADELDEEDEAEAEAEERPRPRRRVTRSPVARTRR